MGLNSHECNWFKELYKCKICGQFESKFKTVSINHAANCSKAVCEDKASELELGDRNEAMITKEDSDQSSSDDFYWNYKNCEFLLDSLFITMHNFS